MEQNSPRADEPKPLVDRQRRQEETLAKLTNGPNPSLAAPSRSQEKLPQAPPMKDRSPSLPMGKKAPEPMSLAAFMGGRATGPRLNKHAPQQDAHDPTQFEQRTHISAPHPVFGRGGVAMPGMASNSTTSTSAMPSVVQRLDKSNGSFWSNRPYEQEKDAPPLTRRYTQAVQEPPVAPEPTEKRERTMSTPVGLASTQSPLQSRPRESHVQRDGFRRPVSQSSTPTKPPDVPPKYPAMRSKTPEDHFGRQGVRSKTPETPIKTPEVRAKAMSLQQTPVRSIGSPPSTAIATPPAARHSLSSSGSPPARKSPVTAHSLARPIQPDPRLPPQTPQVPPSQNPSPAFLRPSPQKDPTPSLSRLQGRGFVQNMIKVSSQMESVAAGSVGSSPLSEKARSASSKKPSVLDRWPAVSANTNSTSPSVTPKSSPSTDVRPVVFPSIPPAPSSPISPKVAVKPTETNRPLKAASSLPSITQAGSAVSPPIRPPVKRKSISEMPPEGSPGLGSSSTLISYIKPTKTGDDPLPLPAPPLEINELGVRTTTVGARDRGVSKPTAVLEKAAQSGKPLSHVRYLW
jgi:hypothetical protein